MIKLTDPYCNDTKYSDTSGGARLTDSTIRENCVVLAVLNNNCISTFSE